MQVAGEPVALVLERQPGVLLAHGEHLDVAVDRLRDAPDRQRRDQRAEQDRRCPWSSRRRRRSRRTSSPATHRHHRPGQQRRQADHARSPRRRPTVASPGWPDRGADDHREHDLDGDHARRPTGRLGETRNGVPSGRFQRSIRNAAAVDRGEQHRRRPCRPTRRRSRAAPRPPRAGSAGRTARPARRSDPHRRGPTGPGHAVRGGVRAHGVTVVARGSDPRGVLAHPPRGAGDEQRRATRRG